MGISGYRFRVTAAYAIVITLAVLLSSYIYHNDRQLNRINSDLFQQTLPSLNTINQLQRGILEHERLLYEYYATTNSQRLRPELVNARSQISQHLNEMGQHPLTKDFLTAITPLYTSLHRDAGRLDHTLSNNRIDWDQARELLANISQAGRNIEPHLKLLAEAIETQAADSSQWQQQRSALGTNLVIGFCLAITTIAILVGFYIERYIRESADRKRLAMFAERNPSPVISTDLQGEVLYSNPATEKLLARRESEKIDARALLPDNLPQLIEQLKHDNSDRHTGIQNVCGRVLQFTVSVLADLHICHIHFEDITTQTEAQANLKFQVLHDPLTKLPNRRQMELKLTEKLQPPGQQPQPFDLLLINVHQFHRITAIHGFQYGDHLLRQVGERLQHELQRFPAYCNERSLFRLEGTTFCAVIQKPGQGGSALVAERLLQAMQRPVVHRDNAFYLQIRCGICGSPRDGQSITPLLRAADAALVEAKRSESNAIQFYDETIHQLHQRLAEIEVQLRLAEKNDELTLFYQPKVSASSGRVVGAEALMRWMRNDRFVYTPAEFIPVAEQSGLIINMGAMALRQAMLQALEWSHNEDFHIAVNLSSRQFQDVDFLRDVEALLSLYPGAERLIELEITETLLMQNIHSSIDIMNKLKSMGFHLSIDDFGTGYSSLSYLKDFPIDKLKIDRSFISNLENSRDDQTLVRSIISLAHSLGLKTVAEGVENEDQLIILQEMGCEEIQGFYFSKPLPADQFHNQIILPRPREDSTPGWRDRRH